MIHEEICTYEVCKLAKYKGFPQDVFGTCEMKSACYLKDGRYYKDGCICPIENAYSAPTQSLLQRWLREEKNLYISIIAHAKSKRVYYEWEVRYISALGNMNKASSVMSIETYRYNTYELALEDALKYALENLV